MKATVLRRCSVLLSVQTRLSRLRLRSFLVQVPHSTLNCGRFRRAQVRQGAAAGWGGFSIGKGSLTLDPVLERRVSFEIWTPIEHRPCCVAPPTHAFSGLVGVCLAERALKRTNEKEDQQRHQIRRSLGTTTAHRLSACARRVPARPPVPAPVVASVVLTFT